MTEIFGSNPFDIVPHLAALFVAYLLAFPLGWNREKEERTAGLRTFPLVAVAACGFVQAAETLMAGQPDAMARILEGIIAGMGFIGGGAILRQKDSVKGTATAASLWATGAIGTAVGLGSYDVAIVLSLITLLTLWVLSPLKPELVREPPATDEPVAIPGRQPRIEVKTLGITGKIALNDGPSEATQFGQPCQAPIVAGWLRFA